MNTCSLVSLTILLAGRCYSSQQADPGAVRPDTVLSSSRVNFSAGMGVSYVSAQDIVTLVNAAVVIGGRESEFKAAVVFFGAAAIPFSRDWVMKVEYGYLLGSYSITAFFGTSDFTFVTHMPSLIFQYILADEGVYNVRVGMGGGYHFGELTRRLSTIEDHFRGNGIGTLVDFEANTSFGDSFFGYLGGELRWNFIGSLTNGSGKSPGAVGTETTLHFFGVGAKFGFTYYF